MNDNMKLLGWAIFRDMKNFIWTNNPSLAWKKWTFSKYIMMMRVDIYASAMEWGCLITSRSYCRYRVRASIQARGCLRCTASRIDQS